jgi:hypothetical protein
MSLTGIPLIVLSAVLTVLVAAATVFAWRRGGRWRLPARVAGLLALEILIGLTAGLIVNRNEGFYPSWQALGGGQDTTTVAPPPSGRLDHTLDGGAALPWKPAAAPQWRLAGSPLLIVPPGYAEHSDRAYPVIVVLTTADRVAAVRAQAAATADALTVVAVPTSGTTAAGLSTLPAMLAQDARATGTGWAIVADAAHTALARQWRVLAPSLFRTVTGTLATAADRLPPPLTAPVRLHP